MLPTIGPGAFQVWGVGPVATVQWSKTRTLQPAAGWEAETKSAAFLHAADILAGEVLHKNLLFFKL